MPEPGKPITQALVREGLRMLLDPDVILMGVRMPGMSGNCCPAEKECLRR
jgi:hypothetical protein